MTIEAKKTINAGCDKQLFIGPWTEDGQDDYLVESMQNVTMTMNEAHVTGERLMGIDRPWEQNELGLLDMSQFVTKDGDIFRMYYSALPKYPRLWEEAYCRILCYAESKDGIHWEKPNLGLWEWQGSRENNIILPNDDFEYVFSEAAGMSVFIDAAAKSPDEKYKMFIKMTPVAGKGTDIAGIKPLPRKGQYALCSPDGVHWKLMSDRKVNPGASDARFSVFWDERIEQYVAYTRVKPPRMVGRMVSDDFLNWSEETVVIAPDEMDKASSPDGSARVEFYNGNVSKYTEVPNIYLAIPSMYSHWKSGMSRAPTDKLTPLPATVDVQLITSRDGIHWNRTPGRKPFIRLGSEGTFWSKMIWPDGKIIRVGDELWMYFAGLDVAHNAEQNSMRSNGARSRAVLRLDGFISADAAYTGGELITKPLIFEGSKLQFNVATGAGGTVQVEIQDESGNPIQGFTAEDANEINGNYIRVFASWKGDTDASSLAGQVIRLRFVMRDAKLYSFQFMP